MRAELKALYWEAADDLSDFAPEDPDRFGIGVTALIGPLGMPGAELFQFTVCTPTWLADQEFEQGFRWGASFLFVSRWNENLVRRAFTDLCRRAEGPDWVTITTFLSRYGYWEFSDYRKEP
jgi:hypothetical protein